MSIQEIVKRIGKIVIPIPRTSDETAGGGTSETAMSERMPTGETVDDAALRQMRKRIAIPNPTAPLPPETARGYISNEQQMTPMPMPKVAIPRPTAAVDTVAAADAPMGAPPISMRNGKIIRADAPLPQSTDTNAADQQTRPRFAIPVPNGAAVPDAMRAGDGATRSRYADPRTGLRNRIRADLEDPYTKESRKGGFFKGAARGALEGFAHGGLGGAIGGAVAGGVGGAIDPTIPQKFQRQREISRDTQNLARLNEMEDTQLASRANRAKIAELEAKPALEQKRLTDENLRATQSRIVSVYNGLESFVPASAEHQQLAAEARAAGISLPPKQKGGKVNVHQLPDGSLIEEHINGKGEVSYKRGMIDGQPISGVKPDKLSIPESFYRKPKLDEHDIEDAALGEVAPKFSQAQIKPEVLQAYGGDMERVQSAIRQKKLSPSEAFADPRHSAGFETALAQAKVKHRTTAKQQQDEANLYNGYVDLTSRDRSKPLGSKAGFDAAFAQLQKDLSRAKTPQQKQKLRSDFEAAARGIRLVD